MLLKRKRLLGESEIPIGSQYLANFINCRDWETQIDHQNGRFETNEKISRSSEQIVTCI